MARSRCELEWAQTAAVMWMVNHASLGKQFEAPSPATFNPYAPKTAREEDRTVRVSVKALKGRFIGRDQ